MYLFLFVFVFVVALAFVFHAEDFHCQTSYLIRATSSTVAVDLIPLAFFMHPVWQQIWKRYNFQLAQYKISDAFVSRSPAHLLLLLPSSLTACKKTVLHNSKRLFQVQFKVQKRAKKTVLHNSKCNFSAIPNGGKQKIIRCSNHTQHLTMPFVKI